MNKKSLFLCSMLLVSSFVQPTKVHLDVFQAISYGSNKDLKIALQESSAILSRNGVGQSVLHVAVAQGNRELIGKLIKAGAQVNALDGSGETPLDLAVKMKNHNIIYQLVKFGGKVTSEINALRLKSIYKSRATKFLIAGIFFTPFLWIGAALALGNASDVMVLTV